MKYFQFIHSKTFRKAITWRVIASCITLVTAFWFTQHISISISIALLHTLSSLAAHLIFEHLWNKHPWGIIHTNPRPDLFRRSFAKTLSWEILTASASIFSTYAVTYELRTSLLITTTATAISFCLFLIHERLWNKKALSLEPVRLH